MKEKVDSQQLIHQPCPGEDVGLLNEAGHWLCDTLGVHVMIPEYPGYGPNPSPVLPTRFPDPISILIKSNTLGVHGMIPEYSGYGPTPSGLSGPISILI